MPHRLRPSRMTTLVTALALVAALGVAVHGDAQSLLPQPTWFPAAEDELQALRSLESGAYVRAREEAEAILKSRRSFMATYVQARVFHLGEGNLARALFLMRKARQMLERSYGDPPPEGEARRWHKQVLEKEIWILGEMDRREEELSTLERYDALYHPPLETQRIWALMKLGRLDEAREIAMRHIYADDFERRSRAYNGLLAIEDTAHDYEKCYQWAKEGMEKTQNRSCVIAANLSLAVMQTVRYDEVEGAVKQSLQAVDRDCPSSPRRVLVPYYLMQAEYQKAISAFKQLRAEPIELRMRVQTEMDYRARLVEVLFAMGALPEAEERMRTVVEAPDRQGLNSFSDEQVAFGNLVTLTAILRARLAQEEERAAARPLWAALGVRGDTLALRAFLWQQRRAAIRLAVRPKVLAGVALPHRLLSSWALGDLIPVVGNGVALRMAAEDRALAASVAARIGPHLDALEGEAYWRGEQWDQAVQRAEGVLRDLPAEDVLLRNRTRAWYAQILLARGERAEAFALLHQVMEVYPAVMRILELSLPVRLTYDDAGDARAVAALLRRSPRLRVDPESPFVVDVFADGEALQACLGRPDGSRYLCVDLGAAMAEAAEASEAERWALAVDAFHRQVFAPRVDLTQTDINTLDGRAARIGAEEALEQILGGRP